MSLSIVVSGIVTLCIAGSSSSLRSVGEAQCIIERSTSSGSLRSPSLRKAGLEDVNASFVALSTAASIGSIRPWTFFKLALKVALSLELESIRVTVRYEVDSRYKRTETEIAKMPCHPSSRPPTNPSADSVLR